MLRRLVSALAILSIAGGVALAQAKQKNTQRDSVRAADFSVHLFFEASGELSPNIFPLEEFAAFNFSAQWKGNNGGKFSGFLIRVRLESRTGTEVFAEGRVAQLILRERKTKKTLQTWNIADVYVGDRGGELPRPFLLRPRLPVDGSDPDLGRAAYCA